jgi:DNA polymerase-3 subunit alpha
MTSSDPHYANPEDADDQRIMVSVNMKETEESIQRKLSDDQESDIMVFFGSNNFYIHSYDEIKDKFTQEELEMTNKVAAMVEEYDISAKPSIPKFDIPNLPDLPFLRKIENPSDKYLMYLCVEGAKKFEPWTKSDKYKREDYWNRLNEEFKVIIEAGLSDYFLIVWDFCMAADNRPADHSFDWRKNLELGGKTDPIPRGVGRGSAAGCLISYLVSITGIDPILYNLIFSRFYNKGRNTADHIELPDIDSDFAVEDREWIIKYIENKYGQENVAQIITFQRMQGRAAIKDVFRVKGIKGGFELSNEICKYIPNEAEVADELQEIRDSGHPDYGLIKYSIDNSDEIQKFIKDEKIKGVLDQAIRCEGVKRGQGRHPSGIIVTPKPVKDHFPMVYDTRSKQKIIGVDMNNAAKLGGVKIDLLGTAILDKLKMTQDLVNKVKPRRNRVDHYQEEIE